MEKAKQCLWMLAFKSPKMQRYLLNDVFRTKQSTIEEKKSSDSVKNYYDKNYYFLKLQEMKFNINQQFSVNIPMNEIISIHNGLIMDCIRGYNPSLAWNLFHKRLIAKQHPWMTHILVKSKYFGGQFLEHIMLGKIRSIVDKINSSREKMQNNYQRIQVLSEEDQHQKIEKMKEEKIAFYRSIKHKIKGKSDMTDEEILAEIGWKMPPTPDVVFSRAILINNSAVHWLDAKNYLITHQDRIKYRKLQQTTKKYNQTFGTGAYVCMGFVFSGKKRKNELKLLDASYW